MTTSILAFISSYGYLAIFALVFFQEIGVPNPVSNELVLLFSGSLAAAGVLSLPLVFLVAVAGDILGTTLLYAVFYHFGDYLIRKLPIKHAKVERLSHRIATKGYWGIFVGRLLPFVRGYASVAAGILRIPPRVFLPCVAASAVLWSGGYVIVGRILGKYWEHAHASIGHAELLVGLGLLALMIVLIFHYYKKRN